MSRVGEAGKSITSPPPQTTTGTATASNATASNATDDTDAVALSDVAAREAGVADRFEGAGARGSYDEAVATAKACLRYGVTDLCVTDGEAREAAKALASLPPAELSKAMGALEKEGLLGRLLDNLPAADRRAFLGAAVKKGVIDKRVAVPGPAPSAKAPFAPPAPPSMYVNDPKLPRSLRAALHEENLGTLGKYREAHGAYMDRYKEGIDGAKTQAELRKLGPPYHPGTIAEPGVTGKDVDFNAAFLKGQPSVHDVWRDVSHKRADLKQERHAGDVWLRLNAETAVGSVKRKGSAEVDSRGNLKGSLGVGGSAKVGKATVSYEADVDASGKLKSEKAGVELGTASVEAEVERDADGKVKSQKLGGKIGNVAAKVERDGKGDVVGGEVEIAGIKAGVNKDAVLTLERGVGIDNGTTKTKLKGGVKVDEKKNEVEQYLAIEAKLGELLEFKAEVALGFAGTDEQALLRTLRREVGFFDIPPELDKRVAWDDLDPVRRAFYEEEVGWTRAEWEEHRTKTDLPKLIPG